MTEEETLDLLLDIKQDIDQERKRIQKEMDSLPYQINIIDELHADERANSRILTKLLQFKSEKGEYDILQSFIDYLRNNMQNGIPLADIKINNPEITTEKDYIDVWIRDEEWAIIIENKIYNAQDQESQLARYIETTLKDRNKNKKGYSIDKIFVIYMPPTAHDPDVQTWTIKKGDVQLKNYYEEFQDRYFNLSFEEDILSWLSKELLPNIRQKDVLLLSAITQYINYLEGIFGKRLIDKEVNMEIEKKIMDKLALDQFKSNNEKINKLNEAIKNTESILKSMVDVKIQYLSTNMENHIQGKSCIENFTTLNQGFQIQFNINQINYKLYVSKDSRYYCQLIRTDKENIQSDDSIYVYQICKEILTNTTKGQKDRMWKYVDSVDEAFDLFEKVVDRLCENSLL
jgi:hypothetical protein